MSEGLMHDPNERDRQQRELTEELRHDANVRAAHKRRAALPEPPTGAAPAALHQPLADPQPPARREPPPAPPGTPAPGHARPDDDLGTEMPELPPEVFPDPSPNPFRGDPAPRSEEHPTVRSPHPQIMMERRSVDAGRPSAKHDAWQP